MNILKRMMKGNSVHPAPGRRDLLHAAGVGAVVAAVGGWTSTADQAAAATTDASTSARPGIRAFKIYTGPDNASHVLEGTIDQKDRTQVVAIHFKETPAHSSLDWHNAPTTQYVITLAGVLEFTTVGGETFTIHPRQILVAEDNSGSGHKWRLVNDEPWKRAYVVFKEGADTHFLPDPA